jgi:adenosylcobinamide kinase/adenosylcobinamide-phosphate guanylyltransferase
MSIALVGGGARSGKSAFALRMARARGVRRLFVATAEAGDGEMRTRIARHRDERGNGFATVEEPLDVARVVREAADTVDVVLVDCLTLWMSNLLLRDESEASILARTDDLLTAAEALDRPVILVTNEVGLGLVPEAPLGRAFRDVAGRVHQLAAARATEIYMAFFGMILRLAPGPVEAIIGGRIETPATSERAT